MRKIVKDPSTGEVSEVHCTYDRRHEVVCSGWPEGRCNHPLGISGAFTPGEVRLYDRPFRVANPLEGKL